MTCVYCGVRVDDLNSHLAAAADGHPEFVVYQAKADRRAESGGPLAAIRQFGEGPDTINHIDREEVGCGNE